MLLAQPKRRWVIVTLFVVALASVSVAIWFRIRYTEAPTYLVTLTTFSNADYPEDPEDRSVVFGNYPHGRLIIHRTDNGRFRFLIEPASEHAARIELLDVDLVHLVAAVPPWVKADPELTTIGLIDRHLDASDRWLDHHEVGVDGPLLHRDRDDPSVLHLYLLSYERHALLNHVVISLPPELTVTDGPVLKGSSR